MRGANLRRGGGTETARPLDSGRMGKAIAAPGVDLRYWVSYGTVGTISDDGTFDPTNGQAIYTSPDGCYVDVLLHPAMQHVTARYSGVQGGASGTIYTPIQPGDEVLVEIPGGDLRLPPVITRILSAEHSRLPMNPDRTPIWQNDRILIHAATVPVEIRTAGGASLTVNQDGTVNMNAGTNGVARLNDTTQLAFSATDMETLATSLLATGGFTPGGAPGPGTPATFTGGKITSASNTVKSG
jgi:hypothetical protein